MRVYAHILTWNEKDYLEDLFESLEAQTYQNLVVRVFDNGSTDGSPQFIREKYPRALAGRHAKNLGFAGGHNQLLEHTMSRIQDDDEESAVLFLNADLILQPTAVEEMVKAIKSSNSISVIQPKLLRCFYENAGDESLRTTVKSDIIDSTGLTPWKGWRFTDRGAGEVDRGQYDLKKTLFGASLAMALIKKEALQDIRYQKEWLDAEFFTYKEDCDLAMRLARKGHQTRFAPKAVAYHYRGMYGKEKQSLKDRLKNRRTQRPFFAALSTRNQALMLIKNLALSTAIIHAPWIILGQGGRMMYGAIFEPETRRRLLQIGKLLPKMLKKRRHIFKNKRTSEAELRTYVGQKST